MEIVVNGEPRHAEEGWAVSDLLRSLELDSRLVAVERNGRVVPRQAHGEETLAAGDRVEIVRFVQGG